MSDMDLNLGLSGQRSRRNTRYLPLSCLSDLVLADLARHCHSGSKFLRGPWELFVVEIRDRHPQLISHDIETFLIVKTRVSTSLERCVGPLSQSVSEPTYGRAHVSHPW